MGTGLLELYCSYCHYGNMLAIGCAYIANCDGQPDELPGHHC